jgi:hypothetical protein
VADLAKSTLGLSHEITLQALHQRAAMLSRLERWEELKTARDELLPFLEKELGADHPLTVGTRSLGEQKGSPRDFVVASIEGVFVVDKND